MDSAGFLRVAAPITNRSANFDSRASRQEFKRMFGTCPEVCEWVWSYHAFHTLFPFTSKPIHLLWAIYFLQHNYTNNTITAHAQTTKKTYYKHAWPIISGLKDMIKEMVSKEQKGNNILPISFVLTIPLILFIELQVKLKNIKIIFGLA